MRFPRIMFCVFMVALLLSAGSAMAERKSSEDIRAAVEKLNEEYKEAYNRGDVDAMVEFYTDDVKAYVSLRPVAEGPEELREWYEMLFETGVKRAIVKITEIYPAGDMVCEIGEYSVYNDQGGILARGYYMCLLKKVNGKWKIYRAMST